MSAISPGRSAPLVSPAEKSVPAYLAVAILVVSTIACLAPFLDKAFCIDDPLFLWSAKQIRAHPLDFFGSEVNWFGFVIPLYDATKNPPLACYYLALASSIVGWSEPALHAAFLLAAIGAICGTWYLARSFCRQPVCAALLTLATPAFLVSSTNVMCDTMLVCFWVWSIALWIKGLDAASEKRSSALCLLTASLLIATAALTKYFGICLIPLLAVYTIIRFRWPTRHLAWLLVTIALLAGYQWWTWHRYGRGLLSDAASYAMSVPPAPGTWLEQQVPKLAIALSFTGGSLIPVLFCAPWYLSKRWIGAGLLLVLAIAVAALGTFSPQYRAALSMTQKFTAFSALQMGIFATTGVLVLSLSIGHLMKRCTADAWLLAFWVFGTLIFAGFVNWTCNVRSVLPMAPAVGILLARRIEEADESAAARPEEHRIRRFISWRWALLPSAGVALMVAWADTSLANSARTAAAEVAGTLVPETRVLWFEAHWGFQYYLEPKGGKELEYDHVDCEVGDLLVIPYNNTNSRYFPNDDIERLPDLVFPICSWLSTMHYRTGAGFYSSVGGPMPFAFGSNPPEKYAVWRIIRPVRLPQ